MKMDTRKIIKDNLKDTKKILLKYIKEAYDITYEEKGYIKIYDCLDEACKLANEASTYEFLLDELEGKNDL